MVAEVINAERRKSSQVSRDFSADDIMNRILSRMKSEARAVLAEGIAQSAADIDVVMIDGFGFPRWQGGPFAIDASTS